MGFVCARRYIDHVRQELGFGAFRPKQPQRGNTHVFNLVPYVQTDPDYQLCWIWLDFYGKFREINYDNVFDKSAMVANLTKWLWS